MDCLFMQVLVLAGFCKLQTWWPAMVGLFCGGVTLAQSAEGKWGGQGKGRGEWAEEENEKKKEEEDEEASADAKNQNPYLTCREAILK